MKAAADLVGSIAELEQVAALEQTQRLGVGEAGGEAHVAAADGTRGTSGTS